MGGTAKAPVLRLLDSLERTDDAEATADVLRQAEPGAVRGEVGERLVALELAVAARGTGEETADVLAPWKDGDSDDYANEVGFTD